eukprot:6357129-Pyramimonas_sp.AAC.1
MCIRDSHMKHPSAGLFADHTSNGDKAGQVSHMAEHVHVRCESGPDLPSDSLCAGRAAPTAFGLWAGG